MKRLWQVSLERVLEAAPALKRPGGLLQSPDGDQP